MNVPAEWRSCDFLCEGQILSGGDETNAVSEVKEEKDSLCNINKGLENNKQHSNQNQICSKPNRKQAQS